MAAGDVVLFEGNISILESALQIAGELRTLNPQFEKAASCVRDFNVPQALKEIDISFNRETWPSPEEWSKTKVKRQVNFLKLKQALALDSEDVASRLQMDSAALTTFVTPRGKPSGIEQVGLCQAELHDLLPYTFDFIDTKFQDAANAEQIALLCAFRSEMYKHQTGTEPPPNPHEVSKVLLTPSKLKNIFDILLIQAKTVIALQERGNMWRGLAAAVERLEEPAAAVVPAADTEAARTTEKVSTERPRLIAGSLPRETRVAAAAADMTEPL